MKTTTRKITYSLAAIVLCLLVLFSGHSIYNVHAADEYTDALTDLTKDSAFNADEYPSKSTDYSLNVIQIAESVNGELFLYVYQPSAETKQLLATSINISTAINDSLYYRNFPLTMLNANGVFAKYRVDTFEVKTDALRYYDISAIYRAFDSSVDTAPDNGNTVSEIAFPVGKLFTASTVDGTVSYTCTQTTVIEILNPFVDFLRYSNGYNWDWFNPTYTYTDVHYIAFNTDLPIDILMEADISFVTQSYVRKSGIGYEYDNDKTPHAPITIKGTETGGNTADGLFAKKYIWERIQSTSNFITTDGLNAETIAAIQNTQWVLCFYETEVQRNPGNQSGHWTENGTKVSEVTILRLKFVTDGKVYNLGVVSDKVTGDDVPGNDNVNEWDTSKSKKGLGLLLMLLVLVLLVVLLAPILPYIIQAVIWVALLPFKAIAALFKAIFGRKKHKKKE